MSRFEDMATDIEMAEREAAIDMARATSNGCRKDGLSAVICRCGEPIPKKRREALPGVQTCIDCAQRQERLKKFNRG